MMGNFYLLNPTARWAAVCISKNACTSLKQSVLRLEGDHPEGVDAIHDRIGYSAQSPYLRPVDEGMPPGYFTFAVWRDPVDRFCSTVQQISTRGYRGCLDGLPTTPDGWIQFAEHELSKPTLQQDEHLRRQSDYYTAEQVDAVVSIEDLATWFESRGWGPLPRSNSRNRLEIRFSPDDEERIRRLYSADYQMICPTVSIDYAKPTVTGLWIGSSLSPLAELCIRSFMDHGFAFRLMTYGDVIGIPNCTEIVDGREVIDDDLVYTHESGSLAPFSDWFRYRLLSQHGGIWTDMDVACLKRFRFGNEPWFALSKESTASIGLLSFPPNHPVLNTLAEYAEDPALTLPWDDSEACKRKERLARRFPDPVERRIRVAWGTAGPDEFTRALQHAGMFHTAAPPSSVYPIHWTSWRQVFNGHVGLDSPLLRDCLAIHLWGEMLRREPDALRSMSPHSITACLMKRHGCEGYSGGAEQKPPPTEARILVGVCSCRSNGKRRQAIRETWASGETGPTLVVFFVGEGPEPIEASPDVVVVGAPDDYLNLPAKILSFFRHSSDTYEFDWLFKCDDDTYVSLDRLPELIDEAHDFVGNEFLANRGSPSGGAGYLLSRAMITRLASDPDIPSQGDEDVLIGRAAIRHGASIACTERLCWNTKRYPRPDNDVITSHWCSPERLRLLDRIARSEPQEVIEAVHPAWHDTLYFYGDGAFRRKSTPCIGAWAQGGQFRRLDWLDWGTEWIVPEDQTQRGAQASHMTDGNKRFRFVDNAVKTITVELRGGLGNQMFQYAHGLALATRFAVPLRLSFANYGRPFGLGIFNLALDTHTEQSYQMIEYDGNYVDGQEWPPVLDLRRSKPGHVKLAGYFQNEGFFRPVAERIREQFKLIPRILPEAEGRHTACLHVRRGDFLGSPTHNLCGVDYYRTAIHLMRCMVDRPLFIVLSDDPGWCETHFCHEVDTLVVKAPAEREALAIMCGCNSFILSNSTFGWWGAWLADASLVIAPNRFLKGRTWNVCPERWITIPCSGLPFGLQFPRHPRPDLEIIARSCRSSPA